MGNFKIEKQAVEEPKYCDYIQEKVDIARKNGAVYELVDEDNRIESLYGQNNPKLTTQDKIKVINRVRSTEDGKEYIVVNKNVDFFTPSESPQNNKTQLVYKDRYSCREGIVELPMKSINPETGATEIKQTRLEYTIPFSAGKVDEYMKKAEDSGVIPQLTFYNGSSTSDRLPSVLPTVGNVEFFKEATWQELLVGQEKKVLNSLTNRLPEVRKELKTTDSKQDQPKEEVNKEETTKQSIVEDKGGKQQLKEEQFWKSTKSNEVSNKKN